MRTIALGTGRLVLAGALAAGVLLRAKGAPAPAAAPAPTPKPAAAVAGPPPPFSPPRAELPLHERIAELLAQAGLTGAVFGISVVDVAGVRTLYQLNPELSFNPASNVKLLTTAAALSLLGPEYRFPTRLFAAAGERHGDTIQGDLWLVGSGDPSLVTGDLYELVSDLWARGVRKISGGIRVDGSRFDGDKLPPGYEQKDELAAYRAPSSAAAVNFNTFVVELHPAATAGHAAVATVVPAVPSVELANRVETVADDRRPAVKVQIGQERGITRLELLGQIPLDGPAQSYRYPVADPTLYAGEVLRLVLKQRGIRVGRTKVEPAVAAPDAELLAVHWSPALSVLIRSVNKISNNFMAEQLLRALDDAQPASFTGGIRRIWTYLESIKMPTQGLVLGNGSGLYDTNRVTARQITHLLVHAYKDFRYSSDFLASLAIMGADGTTSRRLSEGTGARWIRAKTGSLDGVSCLSGYAGAAGMPPIGFSILINGLQRADAQRAKDLQDAIAQTIADEATKPRAQRGG